MKTTYPRRWKGFDKDNQFIKGESLVSDAFHQNYMISVLSYIDNAMTDNAGGRTVQIETIHWECANCETWNHYKQIVCSCCQLKLDRCIN